jgi:hypothetical protein
MNADLPGHLDIAIVRKTVALEKDLHENRAALSLHLESEGHRASASLKRLRPGVIRQSQSPRREPNGQAGYVKEVDARYEQSVLGGGNRSPSTRNSHPVPASSATPSSRAMSALRGGSLGFAASRSEKPDPGTKPNG